jgi:hypothetical protein
LSSGSPARLTTGRQNRMTVGDRMYFSYLENTERFATDSRATAADCLKMPCTCRMQRVRNGLIEGNSWNLHCSLWSFLSLIKTINLLRN